MSSHFDEDLSLLGLLELSIDDLEGLTDLGGLNRFVGFWKSGRHDRGWAGRKGEFDSETKTGEAPNSTELGADSRRHHERTKIRLSAFYGLVSEAQQASHLQVDM